MGSPKTSWLVLSLLLVFVPWFSSVAAAEPADDLARILQAEDSLKYQAFLGDILADAKQEMRVREWAAQAIGHIGDPEGSPALLRALDDGKVNQAVLCRALGELWANTPALLYKIEILPHIPRKLLDVATKSPDPAARAAAFEAIALAFPGHGYREAAAVQSEVAAGKLTGDPAPLLQALMRVAGAPAIELPLEPPLLVQERNEQRQRVLAFGLTHPNADVAYFAAYFAARPATRELNLTEPLKQVLTRNEPLLRAQVLRGLARRQVKDEAVAATARRLLAEGTTQEKIAAVEAVNLLLPPEEVFSLLQQALRAAGTGRSTGVHQAVLETMAGLKAKGVAEFLWDVSRQKVPYHRLARIAAARAGAKEQINGLSADQYAGADEDAIHYIEVLEAAGLMDKLNWLASGLSLPERFVRSLPVRQRLVMALVYDADGKARPEAYRAHPEWLKDPDPVIRGAAAASLIAGKDEKSFKTLVAAWKRAKHDSLPDATLEILKSLDLLTDDDKLAVGASVAVSQMARESLADKRLEVRRKGVELLHKLTREINKKELYGVATGRSLEDYRALAKRCLQNEPPLQMVLRTNKGDIRFTLRRDRAPLTVDHFLRLATTGFYNDLVFHRVVPGFVIQTGDPQGLGFGGPGYSVRDEEGAVPFAAGTLGLASAGHDTGGSQFFFTALPTPHLDGRYTAFGQADEKSLAVIEDIVIGDRMLSIELEGH